METRELKDKDIGKDTLRRRSRSPAFLTLWMFKRIEKLRVGETVFIEYEDV